MVALGHGRQFVIMIGPLVGRKLGEVLIGQLGDAAEFVVQCSFIPLLRR